MKLDPRFVRQGFADELKRMAQKETGIDFFVEENKMQHRKFLIQLGQAYRAYDPDFWVKKLLASLRPGVYPVVTDCRFKNEAKALKAAGFLIIRLDPGEDVIQARGGKLLDDPSETDLDDYLDFDGTIDTGVNSPTAVAAKVMSAFGPLAREELYGQTYRPGDRVRIIGGLYTKERLTGTILEIKKNQAGMKNGPTDPMAVIRLDSAFGGRLQYEMRPNQLELMK